MVESLAETPEQVTIFLNKLSQELRPRVDRDYDAMLTLKKKKNPVSLFQIFCGASWCSGLIRQTLAHRVPAGHLAHLYVRGLPRRRSGVRILARERDSTQLLCRVSNLNGKVYKVGTLINENA